MLETIFALHPAMEAILSIAAFVILAFVALVGIFAILSALGIIQTPE